MQRESKCGAQMIVAINSDIDPEQQDPQLNAIAAMLSGKFDNAEQHASDPSFLPVRFNNCVVKLKPASLFQHW
jgi:hypothetical protein